MGFLLRMLYQRGFGQPQYKMILAQASLIAGNKLNN